jgi:ubiquinone/menaquinone biosynthesis C-methylase UbiE
MQDPEKLLAPFVHQGMTVVEPGPGMGFFTLPLARLVGPEGRVAVIDIQPQMLAGLRRRARKAGLIDRIDARLARPDSLGLNDLKGKAAFALAFAVVHEMPSAGVFFAEVAAVLKPGGLLLLAEPAGHVKPETFHLELELAQTAGLAEIGRPAIRRSLAALFRKI